MTGPSDYPRWGLGWRDEAWARLQEPLDLLIVGGGITGAGLLLTAASRGLKSLLVDDGDFASGSSSRSGKLVHGGMRYLRQGKVGLTRALLLERDRLLAELPGLVEPLEFILPTFGDNVPDRLRYGLAVRLYDVLRGRGRTWHRYSPEEVEARIPGVRRGALDGGYGYLDAVTDDARLVLRTLREAVGTGGWALNYVQAESLVREGGRVTGAELVDQVSGRAVTARARVVFNATGARADRLRGNVGAPPRLRPIRGTHLVFPHEALPLERAMGCRHPANGRYIYFLPWEGVTLVGTTDRDDSGDGGGEPRATGPEVDYLMEGVSAWLPGARVGREHLLGAFAGVRPAVATGNPDPYREGRDSAVWEEEGLVTVISGKLTGFRPVVESALRLAAPRLAPQGKRVVPASPGRDEETDALAHLAFPIRRRLLGRYGPDAPHLVAASRDGDMERVGGTAVLWSEVRWGARAEGVVHLDDLLLRRARLGLLLPEGGVEVLPRVRSLCQEELGWGAERWAIEEARYRLIWAQSCSVPGR
ncbi:MAG: glycerol-3-phosphate dehydrogenase/oxidase [Longimicrobiales bacterium]|nr:glycerol-3-phosphate dehydrogenase/oxidase [Longimicrobiales bacterium]